MATKTGHNFREHRSNFAGPDDPHRASVQVEPDESIELKVPVVGESITEAMIGEWLKAEGDWVEQDDDGDEKFEDTQQGGAS